MVHAHPLFNCYFGDTKDQLNPKEYLALSSVQDILHLHPFMPLKKLLAIEQLIFLRQTHSTKGYIISSQSDIHMPSFSYEGDYLVTNQLHVGIGVMTADCIPLILFDAVKGVLGIAHAGWKGSVSGVSVRMLESMREKFDVDPQQVTVYFGPSAHTCCYEVQEPFRENLIHLSFANELIQKCGETLYFDTIQCNKRLLENAGIQKSAFRMQYSICTICNRSFCSNRRGDVNRQMTVVSLT